MLVVSRFFEGPAGRLDARLHGDASRPAVLVLHPHPRFGGTMGSRLVYDLAVGLAEAGLHAVRFDFRGVGRSEGAYGGGAGEVLDAVAVFDALAQSGAAPALVGYSFGGGVACRVAMMRTPRRLVLIGTPLAFDGADLDPVADAPRVACPVDIVVGTHDGFVGVGEARALAERFADARVHVVEGAGHFLEPSRNPQAVAVAKSVLAG